MVLEMFLGDVHGGKSETTFVHGNAYNNKHVPQLKPESDMKEHSIDAQYSASSSLFQKNAIECTLGPFQLQCS